jgi:hypothetical protein
MATAMIIEQARGEMNPEGKIDFRSGALVATTCLSCAIGIAIPGMAATNPCALLRVIVRRCEDVLGCKYNRRKHSHELNG